MLFTDAETESTPHVIWHHSRNLHRKFDQTTHFALHAPSGLVDHLVHAALFDRIDIRAPLVKQPVDHLARVGVMAGDQRPTAHIAVDRARTHILVEHDALGVTHRDGAIKLFGPKVFWIHKSRRFG